MFRLQICSPPGRFRNRYLIKDLTTMDPIELSQGSINSVASRGLIRPLRPCSAPGCPTLTGSARCQIHQRARNGERGTTKERGYGDVWPRVRTIVLAEEPFCRVCLTVDQVTPATEVDHILPLSQGGARLDRTNLQPLCGNCHRIKTRAETLGMSAGGGVVKSLALNSLQTSARPNTKNRRF